MSEWIEWSGGEQPVADGVKVNVLFGEGGVEQDTGHAGKWEWRHTEQIVNLDAQIVKYRVVA